MNRLFLLATLALGLAPASQAQIASQSFESDLSDTWSITAGAANVSTADGAADFPASQRLRTGANSWQVINGTATLDLADQSVAGYVGVKATVRLSSTSVTSGNGADASDVVRVFVALDGGPFGGTADVTIAGNSNARWGFGASGIASTTAGTPISVAGNAGTSVTSPATIEILVPDGTTSIALRVVALNNAVAEIWNVDDITLTGSLPVGEVASVAFSTSSATVVEGGLESVNVILGLVNEQGGNGLDAAVSGSVVVATGNPAFVSFVGTYSFPIGTTDGAMQAISITAVDDGVYSGDRDVAFEFGPVTGGTGAGTYTLTITEDEAPPPPPPALAPGDIAIINYGSDGNDTFSFVTLVDIPAGLTEIHFTDNGWTAAGALTTNEGTRTWVGPPAGLAAGTVVTWSGTGGFDVGSEAATGTDPALAGGGDQVLAYQGTAASPTFLFALNANVGGWDADASNTNSSALPQGLVEYVTAVGLGNIDNWIYDVATVGATGSKRELLQLIADDGNWLSDDATPYAAPSGPFTVNTSMTVTIPANQIFDGAGWRMLSAPVQGLTADDLAGINLVQGTDTQYPAATDNLLLGYEGGGTGVFVPAASGTDAVTPGRGFFWYWFDSAFGPLAGGTSQSYELSTFDLSATGAVNTADIQQTFGSNGDSFYLIGNPFPDVLPVTGISADLPIQAGVVQAYNPNGGGYTLFSDDNGEGSDYVGPWQGFYAELAVPILRSSGLAVTFTYDFESTEPGFGAGFVGKASATSSPRLSFTLLGTTADGTTVRDEAAIVRFRDGATDAWDIHDASKLTPLAATHAMLAPVTTRDGAAYRTAISSLPAALDAPAVVPVSFLATDAGSYEIAWTAPLPAGWTAELRDLVTGTVTDLASSATYAFTSEATGWTPRFELVVTASGVVATESGEIAEAALGAPQPNPASGATTFALTLGAAEHVTATLYDALGRSVATVFTGDLPSGSTTEFSVNAADLAPGVYVLRVAGDTFAQSRRLTVVR